MNVTQWDMKKADEKRDEDGRADEMGRLKRKMRCVKETTIYLNRGVESEADSNNKEAMNQSHN